ncbi:GAF domain-containing protein [Planobispora siamensis]|uniref:GAF domain-containing protein n=1 Tax=Planobispora siamensis TaxID=936338 RepID=A0A8J3SPD6_9ACTN|nr:GAF domain-containing protein [Planobispora siamensis]GIH97005.1 hypothetical protein Psi01_76350 [Planobispora siamensis]
MDERLERLRSDGDGISALRRLFLPAFAQADRGSIPDTGLRATLDLTGAGMGNVQLLDEAAGGLTIAAQHGFDRSFPDFFAVVGDDGTACGRVMRTRAPVLVHDVERDRFLARTPATRVLLEAGVRAVCSLPLLDGDGDGDGAALGVLSVHYRAARELTDAKYRLPEPLSHRLGRSLRDRAPEVR